MAPRRNSSSTTAGRTTLDSHLDAPSITSAGDGPADTTDPLELAASARPDTGAAAAAGHSTVNAVVKVGRIEDEPETATPRIETYRQVRPDGRPVIVTHNLDTGTTTATPVTN